MTDRIPHHTHAPEKQKASGQGAGAGTKNTYEENGGVGWHNQNLETLCKSSEEAEVSGVTVEARLDSEV